MEKIRSNSVPYISSNHTIYIFHLSNYTFGRHVPKKPSFPGYVNEYVWVHGEAKSTLISIKKGKHVIENSAADAPTSAADGSCAEGTNIHAVPDREKRYRGLHPAQKWCVCLFAGPTKG